ncbi:Alpha/Beta hydrolase protein [Baffinella frigidus]|nr:Alpha/Beta hydrolase protein [Cryptophyta sp. CCMP2293]
MSTDLYIYFAVSVVTFVCLFLCCPPCARCLPFLCGNECCCCCKTEGKDLEGGEGGKHPASETRTILPKIIFRLPAAFLLGYAISAILVAIYASTFTPYPGTSFDTCKDTCADTDLSCCTYTGAIVPYTDVSFTSSGETMHGWWIPSANGSNFTILYNHGSGANVAVRYRQDRYQWMRSELGVNVFVYDYPGYGKSKGSPDESKVYQSGRDALSYVKTRLGQTDAQLLVLGRSMGNAVATKLGSESDTGFRGLIIQSGWSNYKEVAAAYAGTILGWVVSSMWEPTMSSEENMKEYKGCYYQYHSTADEWIPYRLAEKLWAAASKVDKSCSVAEMITEDKTLHDDAMTTVQKDSLKAFVWSVRPAGF